MMGKQKAASIAREQRLTWGELKDLVERAKDKGGQSSLNGAISLARACQIYAAALEQHDSAAIPNSWRSVPYTGVVGPGRDFWLVTNVLRDCGQ